MPWSPRQISPVTSSTVHYQCREHCYRPDEHSNTSTSDRPLRYHNLVQWNNNLKEVPRAPAVLSSASLIIKNRQVHIPPQSTHFRRRRRHSNQTGRLPSSQKSNFWLTRGDDVQELLYFLAHRGDSEQNAVIRQVHQILNELVLFWHDLRCKQRASIMCPANLFIRTAMPEAQSSRLLDQAALTTACPIWSRYRASREQNQR